MFQNEKKGLSFGHRLTAYHLQGQCHEIFDYWFFSWISFPQASEYTITAISNFFENSQRYSRLKVHHRCQRHRWQMAKIFKLKNFNNFVWAPLGSRVNIYINFCLQVHFKVSAAWYFSHYLPPVSTTQGELVVKFAAGVVDTGCSAQTQTRIGLLEEIPRSGVQIPCLS